MNHKLVICSNVDNNINAAPTSALNVWQAKGYATPQILMQSIIARLNAYNEKLNIQMPPSGIEVRNTISIYGSTCNYIGLIESVEPVPKIKAYVFFTQPIAGSRSAFFEQQFFPVISSVMDECMDSDDNHLTNRPVYIININTDNMTSAMALSMYSGRVVGFNIIDMMDNDIDNILLNAGYDTKTPSVDAFDQLITGISKSNTNDYFELDNTRKIIKYRTNKFTDKNGALKTSLTNEPYWFMLKSLAAIYMDEKGEYSLDASNLSAVIANKSLDAFRNYIQKIGG